MSPGELWQQSRNTLVSAVAELGFPSALGDAMARHLGSPKAMDRMTAYLHYMKPTDVNIAVDEMLAISEEIAA